MSDTTSNPLQDGDGGDALSIRSTEMLEREPSVAIVSNGEYGENTVINDDKVLDEKNNTKDSFEHSFVDDKGGVLKKEHKKLWWELTGHYNLEYEDIGVISKARDLKMAYDHTCEFEVDFVNKEVVIWNGSSMWQSYTHSIYRTVVRLPSSIDVTRPKLDTNSHIVMFLRYCRTKFSEQQLDRNRGDVRSSQHKERFSLRCQVSKEELEMFSTILKKRPRLKLKRFQIVAPSTLSAIVTLIDMVLDNNLNDVVQIRRFELLLSYLVDNDIGKIYNTLVTVKTKDEMNFQLRIARAHCQGLREFYLQLLATFLGMIISLASLFAGSLTPNFR